MTCGCNTPSPPSRPPRTPAEHRAAALKHRKKPNRRAHQGPIGRSDGPVFFTKAPVRHLCMHVWPVKGEAWAWNVDQILARFDQFNGRKTIGISVGSGSEDADRVKEKFAGLGCEFVVRPNASIGEVATAPEMLRRTITNDPDDIVFYCHAKGVKHRLASLEGQPVIRWADVMYHTLLDDPQAINAALVNHSFAGSFRRKFGTNNNNWHYSGTFYWLRSAFVGQTAIGKIGQRYAGMEFWPPRVAAKQDSACIFHDDTQNLYSNAYWRASVLPDLADWESKQETLSVIVPCHNYGRYLGDCLRSIFTQPSRPTEVVVVDDSSDDDTPDVAAQFPVKYVRIDDRDPHEARRAGFRATKGKYVCFVDADDVLGDGYLESAVNTLKASHATIAYSDVQHFGKDETRLHHNVSDIRLANHIHGGSVCRRDALRESGVLNAPLPGARNRYSDWWLWRNALRCGGTAVWHEGVYYYRKHGLSLSDVRSIGNVTEEYRHCRDLLGRYE
jgi:hypothetical protein